MRLILKKRTVDKRLAKSIKEMHDLAISMILHGNPKSASGIYRCLSIIYKNMPETEDKEALDK